ncbi:hypothetical protein BH721_01885 [Clostridium baratii]|nr:hypothetical protein A1M12_02590 [Clostridium baratii]OPF54481.1 hypothetical protein BH724_14550 [Clostridium baratii]OPF55482.1 hypothetical protein BH721_01885 [Clostridium baratii]OPF60137.1 hypothetical protein BH725_06040 [Clostridium baratii]
MKNLTNYTCFALFFNAIWLFLSCFNLIPDAISHFLAGMGLTLMLFSAFAETHHMKKLKTYKRNLLKKSLSK